MPIKPELRYFYPIDWPQISHWVRFVRAKGRCQVCGRPRGYMRRFAMCRICFRERALLGQLPGVTKSSW